MTRNVTFWSYKGGVGRTIALVNTAYQLARAGKRVVIWEMDLEAPGLLKIPLFSGVAAEAGGGVIDILEELQDDFSNLEPLIRRCTVEFRDTDARGDVRFHILPAGKPDESYHDRYSRFEWNSFFDGGFGYAAFEELQRKLGEIFEADLILIDSRTGITDLSAICCIQLPDTVVLVSTLAHQGMSGVADMKRTIWRRNQDTRFDGKAIETVFLLSQVPDLGHGEAREAALRQSRVRSRLDGFRAAGLVPDFSIGFQEDLLVEERIVSREEGDFDPNGATFSALASRLSRSGERVQDSYLTSLAEETGWLDTPWSGQPASRVPIQQFYAPREASLPTGVVVPLQSSLDARRAVILGEAGSGKTTFLRWISQTLPRTGAYPVMIRLAELDRHIEQTMARNGPGTPAGQEPEQWLAHFLQSRQLALPRGQLHQPESVLLLDGLDECRNGARRALLAGLIEQWARAYPEARIIVSARPDGPLPSGFTRFSIGPLDDHGVDAHLRVLCLALHSGDAAAAERRGAGVANALSASPPLRELARNPMILSAMVWTHCRDGRLPVQRTGLFGSMVEGLVRASELDGRSQSETLGQLSRLALRMQTSSEGQLRQMETSAALDLLSADQLDSLEQSGIVRRNQNSLEFAHPLIQEYLAARSLTNQSDAELHQLLASPGLADAPHLRETLVFLAGLFASGEKPRIQALMDAIVDSAGSSIAERATRVSLVRAMLRDLRPELYLHHPGYHALAREMTGLFFRGAAPGLSLSVRLEAAQAFTELGDPRLRLPSDPDYWVQIPPGEALLGAHTRIGVPGHDREAEEGEEPIRGSFGGFLIGRYPVTVHEYAGFVKQGGPAPKDWDRQTRNASHPVVNVTWEMARAYSDFAHAALPSDHDWEFAARGTEGRRFPWGEDPPDETRANFNAGLGCSPVGLFPEGATPDGLLDMAGNVLEWTRGGSLRGGSWRTGEAFHLRAARKGMRETTRSYDDVGFRLIRMAP